jgi:UDP-glucose 4-epimerase
MTMGGEGLPSVEDQLLTMADSDSTPSNPSNPCWILVTGGCGYIGSHTIVVLLQKGYSVVAVDNLVNASEKSLDRVATIVGLSPEQRSQRLKFCKVDLCDRRALDDVFQTSPKFQACIHFAGLKVRAVFFCAVWGRSTSKPRDRATSRSSPFPLLSFRSSQAVGESTRIPIRYYENNLGGTFHLLELMDLHGCHRLVFSSSATVYGAAETMPLTEHSPVGAGITNAYGRTKYMIEEICKDFYNSKVLQAEEEAMAKATGTGTSTSTNNGSAPVGNDWKVVVLRYFNPVGAHPSGLIGEDPHGIPNNLMPYVAQVAIGRRSHVTVFGDDYPTPDGTGVRDYLHVMDLAEGHISALEYMERKNTDTGAAGGLATFNLGAGTGCSVLDMVNAMSKACGHDVPYKVGPRRPGDIAVCYADPRKAKDEMGWQARRSLDEMCRDLWTWQSKNPNGYAD